ncbi:MAG: 5-oxoprolinase subunit PxpB [Hyphomonadaceae bacterium]|nr:5-oxoprolinase subunit PxpB [Hyphomonadaceae bacterium]
MAETFPLCDTAICVRAAGPSEAQTLAARLRATEHWQEVIAGMDSVCLVFNPLELDMPEAAAQLESELTAQADAPLARAPQSHILPVRYGGAAGPDLADLSARLDMTEAAFIALHTRIEHTVDMIGFTPGFAYISGLPRDLEIPRLATPRTHVPAGSVGVKTGQTGTYAMPGPGGWPLIGKIDLTLFDADANDPFRLHPGDTIRFEAL